MIELKAGEYRLEIEVIVSGTTIRTGESIKKYANEPRTDTQLNVMTTAFLPRVSAR